MRTGRTQLQSPCGKHAAAAFTLNELAVLVAIFSVLALVGIAAVLRNSDQIKRAQCRSNLMQFAAATQIYGNEYGDKLPSMSPGNWAWDLPWTTGTIITQWISWKQLYCPGTSVRFTEQDNYSLWNYAPNNLRVIGYVPAFNGSFALIASNQNLTLTPQRISAGTGVYLPAPPASERVLLADATISGTGQYTSALRNTYNYTAIPGGFVIKAHISPHLRGILPAGGNVSMLDGHVEWRDFDQMQCRVSGGSTPGFWW